MVQAEVLQGVRQRCVSRGCSSGMSGVSYCRRKRRRCWGSRSGRFGWRDRLRDEGPEGLRDRRIGKPSSRRAAAEEILRMLGLYQERYEGFTVKHFHEQLQKRSINALRIPVNLTRQQQPTLFGTVSV